MASDSDLPSFDDEFGTRDRSMSGGDTRHDVIDGVDDDETLLYELEGWDDARRAQLADRLTRAGIPFEWDGGDLVVGSDDEELVDIIIDQVEFPDALVVDEGDTGDPEDVLGDLFLAADRLKHSINDSWAVDRLHGLVAAIRAERPPYGFDEDVWERVVSDARSLDSVLPFDDADDIQQRAADLRELLRPYV